MWEVPTAISLTSPRTLRRAVSSIYKIISLLGTNSSDSPTKIIILAFVPITAAQKRLVIVYDKPAIEIYCTTI